jgi:energy-coupling factor transporter ATP-binding protein EcfA2
LLVDEPDVHLHPDLQDRLAQFIVDVLKEQRVTLILATHSTSLLSALAERADTRVAFMRQGDVALSFKAVSDVDRAILPMFGAHPLSNVFNEAPVLLLEGEDDERIWQQAVLQPEAIDDVGHVKRMRLSCRAAENLMLTNECLALAATNWGAVQTQIREWSKVNVQHQYHAEIQTFIDGGFQRKGHDLKEIRNILLGLISTKPWEVLVGQTIAKLTLDGGSRSEGSLRDYLGEAVTTNLLKIAAPSRLDYLREKFSDPSVVERLRKKLPGYALFSP